MQKLFAFINQRYGAQHESENFEFTETISVRREQNKNDEILVKMV